MIEILRRVYSMKQIFVCLKKRKKMIVADTVLLLFDAVVAASVKRRYVTWWLVDAFKLLKIYTKEYLNQITHRIKPTRFEICADHIDCSWGGLLVWKFYWVLPPASNSASSDSQILAVRDAGFWRFQRTRALAVATQILEFPPQSQASGGRRLERTLSQNRKRRQRASLVRWYNTRDGIW